VSRCDIDALHTHGYSDEQILEAILVVGLAKYANYVSFGLGAVPDFNVSSVVQQHSQVASP
jgi:alkylhydroperoxidase family enzyme